MAEVEVYESSDLPEDDQHPSETQPERFESEHIESVELDVGAALQRFKGRVLSTDDADFSGSLGGSGRKVRGYRGGGAYVLELLPSRPPNESVQERYNRLRQEILDLGKEVADLKAAKPPAKGVEAVTAEDVAGLERELGGLEVEWVTKEAAAAAGKDPSLGAKLAHSVEAIRAQGKPKETAEAKGRQTEGGVKYDLAVGPRSLASAKAAQLEARLGALEHKIGSGKSGGAGGSESLSAWLEWLERRVGLLEPGVLEAADARLEAILKKLSQTKESEGLSSSEASGVTELLERARKCEEFGWALPEVLGRLEALEELHLQALHFAQSLAALDAAQKELTKTSATEAQLIKDTRDSAAANLAELHNVSKALEARINALK